MPDASLQIERPEYYVQTGSMFDNPWGVPHKEIVSMMLELPAEMAAQVIFGKYVESSGLVFSGELVQMLFDRTGYYYGHAPIEGPFPRITGDRWVCKRTFEEVARLSPERKKTMFASGVDFARINDFTVLITLDIRTRPARVVAYRRLNRVPWEGIYREVGRVISAWGPNVLCDSTGMAGDVIQDALDDRLYCPIHDRTLMGDPGMCMDRQGRPMPGCKNELYIPLSAVEGFQFTRSSKHGLIENLRNLMSVGYSNEEGVEFGWLRCPPIVQLEEELSFYAWDDKGLDTDCVMALALAAYQGIAQSVGDSYEGSPYGA